MRVSLNGHYYELKEGTGVTRSSIQEWPQNIRLDGQQQRKDRQLKSSWAIDSWSSGLGRQIINTATQSDLTSLWDAENVDTRIDGQIVLSPQFQMPTISPSRGDLGIIFDYRGDLYFAETARSTTISTLTESVLLSNLYSFIPGSNIVGSNKAIGQKVEGNYSRTIWGSLSSLWSDNDMVYYSGVLLGSVTSIFKFYSYIVGVSTLGIAGSVNVGDAAATPTNNSSIYFIGSLSLVDGIKVTSKAGTYHVLAIGQDNLARFFLAPIGGGTLSPVATFNISYGTLTSPLSNDGLDVYACLSNGVYEFDETPAVVVSSERSKDANSLIELFQDRVYFKNKKSLIDTSSLKDVGLGIKDGVVNEKNGEITAMCSSWKYLFAAVKGGTYSHILTRDQVGAWQYYARIPTAGVWVKNLMLSNNPDGIDRLWCIFNTGWAGYFYNPLVNPLQAGTYSYVPTGEFTPPIYDGGLVDVPAGIYQMSLFGGSIDASNKITAYYGLDGVAAITTLGVISSTSQSLKFGSPAGVDGYTIQPKFMLTGSGGTPVFRKAIIDYLKDPDKREQFQFIADLDKTSKMETRSLESVIGSLSYESNRRTLMPFWYGQIATRYVKMINNPFVENVPNQDTFESERKGEVTIQLAELI